MLLTYYFHFNVDPVRNSFIFTIKLPLCCPVLSPAIETLEIAMESPFMLSALLSLLTSLKKLKNEDINHHSFIISVR